MAQEPPQANGLSAEPDLLSGPMSLKIVVVGAGIAGLTAAVALRRHGHQVHVYEQSQLADEIGAAIHISPNANSILRRLGIDVGERGATRLLQTRYHNSSCELLSCDHNEAQSYRWQAVRTPRAWLSPTDNLLTQVQSWLQAHRGHLHAQLKDRATSTKYGGGPAACLHTSSRIVEVDPQHATITLANGDVVHADVLVGADGVRSIARRAVAGPKYDSFEIGKSAFRFMVPRAAVLADPSTRELGEAMGSLDMFFAEEHKVIMYPCVNDTLLNIVCIHPAHQSNASAETYNKSVSREKVLEIFHDFSPKLLKVFEKCDSDTLKVYPLFDALSMPTFVRGRLALIGDAAHPFTPFIGQGGATAIEDAVSLGVMLSNGLTPAEVPERLQVYNRARHGRATTIQGHSRTAGGDGVKPGEEKAARMKGREHAFYALSHDEFHASTQVLREHEWSKLPGAIWRQPTDFGPMPGPPRDVDGRVHLRNHVETVTTASIKFKTSGTLLRNMLPSKSYSFASKDTVALASLTIQSHRNVEWLGFHGYDRVSLEIHGVNYTKLDGSVISGRYVPVMFENSADVISAGREEMGYPSLFSDIDLDGTAADGSSFYANLSWKGVRWATIWLKDLEPVSAKERASESVFVHRCIPAVTDKPGKIESDVDHDIVIEEGPFSTSDLVHATNGDYQTTNDTKTPVRMLSSKASRHAGFEIMPHSRMELPTLHHVTSRVAELPILDIVSAMVWEEEGPENIVRAFRIS